MLVKVKKFAGLVRAFAGTPAGAQVGRFARLGVTAALAEWWVSGHSLTAKAFGAAFVAGAEVVYRAFRRTALTPRG